MRPKELIPILADAFGVPFETAWIIDRSLSEAGLRVKGRGRKPPDMTRRDAIHFLIACMVSNVATRAADDVAVWISANAELSVHWIDCRIGEELAALGEDPESKNIDRPTIDRSNNLPFLKGLHGKSMSLIDYLLLIIPHLEKNGGADCKIILSPSHLDATVEIFTGFGKWDSQSFCVSKKPDDFVEPDPEMGKRVEVSVYGDWLLAVACRTEDPNNQRGAI